MIPILLCSAAAAGIIIERFWSLQRKRIAPRDLVLQVWQWARAGQLGDERIRSIARGSPLGRVLAGALRLRHRDRAQMKEHVEDVGRHVAYDLERYLDALGTIAAVTPLLGLLGTVIGMIRVFAVITTQGVGNAGVLSGGISQALITTAAGLTVAIPSLFFYRYFRSRVDELVVTMEQDAFKLIEALHEDRNQESQP